MTWGDLSWIIVSVELFALIVLWRGRALAALIGAVIALAWAVGSALASTFVWSLVAVLLAAIFFSYSIWEVESA